MVANTLHQNEPTFLGLPETQWPTSTFIPVDLDNLPETKSVFVLLHVTNSNVDDEINNIT